MDIDISCATAILQASSMMLRTRNCLPHSILSLIKSIDQVILGSSAITELGGSTDCFFYFGIIFLLCIVEVGAMDLHQLARPRDAYTIFFHYLSCQFFLYLGL